EEVSTGNGGNSVSVLLNSSIVSIAGVADAAEAGGAGKFRVTQTKAGSTDTVLTYTVAGTASGSDYVALSGTVTIPAGQTTAEIDVAALEDALVEGTETVVVTLSGVTSGDPQVILDAANR